jgi:ribosomal protein L34E
MRTEIEKRLHRVIIRTPSTHDIRCNYSSKCDKAQNCERCNNFFLKCNNYMKLNSEFQGI